MSSAVSNPGPNQALSAPVQAALESLERYGLAIVPFAELIGDEELWAQLAGEADGFAGTVEDRLGDDDPGAVRRRKAEKRAGKKGKKNRRGESGGRKTKKTDFILRSSAVEGAAPSPAMLRYALSDQLLGISNAYLGLRAKLTYVDKWYTAPSPRDANRTKSQRWHRDHIDPHILKVFTYFTDVDEEAGAIEYVTGSAPGGPYGDLWSAKEEHYPPDDEFERTIPRSACRRAEGPIGTIVLCDTGGFHRGGFARRPRITANFTYVSPAALAEGRTDRRFELGDALPPALSEAGRFALA